jgi:hypothetical protein
MRKLLLFLFFCLTSFSLSAQCTPGTNSVSDSIMSNNGQRGQMFNIVALTNITIHCFSPELYAGVLGTYSIYYRNGSFSGHQNTAASWIFIDSAQNLTGTLNVGTLIPIDVNIPILAGDTLAFYITCRGSSASYGGIRYYGISMAPAGPLDSTWLVDANMKLLVGIGKDYPFSTNFITRRYLGQVHYSLGITPLPLDFISFNAENKENYNLLKWTTENETNTSYFAIEKSEDGDSFETLGKVEAAGNYNGQLDYDFQDNSLVRGRNYYRLTCFDLDGKFAHSEIISIYSESMEEICVFPNPFATDLNIQLDNYEQSFKIYDAYGQLIQKGENVPSNIDLSQVSAGIYFLKIGNKNIQIIKQ